MEEVTNTLVHIFVEKQIGLGLTRHLLADFFCLLSFTFSANKKLPRDMSHKTNKTAKIHHIYYHDSFWKILMFIVFHFQKMKMCHVKKYKNAHTTRIENQNLE